MEKKHVILSWGFLAVVVIVSMIYSAQGCSSSRKSSVPVDTVAFAPVPAQHVDTVTSAYFRVKVIEDVRTPIVTNGEEIDYAAMSKTKPIWRSHVEIQLLQVGVLSGDTVENDDHTMRVVISRADGFDEKQ